MEWTCNGDRRLQRNERSRPGQVAKSQYRSSDPERSPPLVLPPLLDRYARGESRFSNRFQQLLVSDQSRSRKPLTGQSRPSWLP